MPDRVDHMRSSELEIVGTTGTYSEERLFILETVRRLEKKIDEQIEKTGATNQLVGKVTTDLNRLGGNVRALSTFKDQVERRLTRLEAKAVYIAAGTGATVAGLFQVGKYLLGHR